MSRTRTSRSRLLHQSPYSTLIARQNVLSPGWHVVKIVSGPHDGHDPSLFPHNVKREIDILRSIRHPSVIKILDYEYDELEREHRLSLPFLPLTLSTLLDRPLEPSTWMKLARSISLQLCIALGYLHSLGVAHRDVNPSNIMLDRDGTLVLVDFSIAWRDNALDQAKSVEKPGLLVSEVGTGPYRAPELLFGSTAYDPQAIDLWATGATLAEFFTSVPTFNPSDPAAHIEAPDALEDEDVSHKPGRRHLFDDSFGNLGLAASIFRSRGSPSEVTWPGFKDLPDAGKVEFEDFPPAPLQRQLLGLEDNNSETQEYALDFLGRLPVLNPGRRMTAREAIKHSWLASELVLVPDGYEGSFDATTSGKPDASQWTMRSEGVSLADILRPHLDAVQHTMSRWRQN